MVEETALFPKNLNKNGSLKNCDTGGFRGTGDAFAAIF